MENTPFKLLLLNLLQTAYEAQQTWFQGLSAEEQAATGSVERWSARNHIAHLTFWRKRLNFKLEAVLRGEQPSEFPALDPTDASILQQYQLRPLAEILSESEEAHHKLLTLTRLFSEEDLLYQHYSWVDAGSSLGGTIMCKGYSHPLEHIAQFYLERNDLAQATRTRETLVDQILPTTVPTNSKGIEVYNLACFYATNNILGKVLETLLDALRFYPDLKEWALNDPDLIVVRHHIK